jgi:hypothetical protein
MFMPLQALDKIGAPGRIRTSDPLVRSQMLYPAELRARDDVKMSLAKNSESFAFLQLGGCRGWWWRWRRRGCGEGHSFDDVEAGAAQELVDDRLGEAAGVELNADGLLGLVELYEAYAVDLAHPGHGEGR